ncbi:MBL fold metallo-hydrolase [Flavobacterium sp. MC2016-06]|jgi:beta-lactamase superfamily II metal-dependent hydrolase|uniref:ComEC/Rec2 family competence protein n=1 Tax=Flavobacterium sp. MC2016-06 TaxID=2676308 RepID=UPI0012BB010E|nr:MBL fold metallo-hydrolase [Flavobacterium sp. MC2016-06]MBU3861483.1 MBL fold metallo-hydrolase [Flavobacterium sp. MC2016-06]
MTEKFGLEIDYMPVGNGTRSGDAIALRFGECENGVWKNQTVFVIDGGNEESGKALVDHIKNIYNTNKVDRVILTHTDADHACGLKIVLQNLEVGKIWMHCPWNHWDDIKDYIVDGRITRNSFSERMREAYQYAYNIEKLANEKGIKIVSPQQGLVYTHNDENILKVLGPSKELYLSLIQASGKTPDMALFESTRIFSSSDEKTVYETMSFETENLADTDMPTSAENDMSLVLLLTVGGEKVLFTGDSGTQGLFKSIHYATANQISLKDLNLLHVPHHGSRRNLSKGILKYINAKYCIISCSKEGFPKHPSPIVTNSLIRRGMAPYCTKGTQLNYRSDLTPVRKNVYPIPVYPFITNVQIPSDI